MEFLIFLIFGLQIGTPTYKLAKFCDKLLKRISTIEYAMKGSFSFAKEVKDYIMKFFDVRSPFKNLSQKLLAFVSKMFIENKHILIIYQKLLFIVCQ